MNGTSAFVVVVAVFVAVLILIRLTNRYGGRKVIGRRATLSELLADPETDRLSKEQYRAVVHQTPDHDAVPQLTACCDLPLPEVPPEDDWSCEPSEVTCTGGEG